AATGIRSIVVATTEGSTGVRASEVFKGRNVVVVSHAHGFKTPNEQELRAEDAAKIKANGAHLVTCGHPFAGVGRAVRRKYNTYELDDLFADCLRMFGQGVKVTIEIAMMAADAGLIRTDEDVICVGGTNRGADTAVVLRAANTQDFFKTRIQEILCKPKLA
ncbi:MAG: hypothetical protein M1531_06845, partial [Chloroflexi bacterium]|nr:hypothetical protein [Chloroflexota bacterium]